MVAMDVVREDGRTLDPAARDAIVQKAFESGLLLLGCGEAAIRFCPPLCISAEQIETALHLLDEVLAGSIHESAVAV
jgi:4-aminobutyrate aminotransferase